MSNIIFKLKKKHMHLKPKHHSRRIAYKVCCTGIIELARFALMAPESTAFHNQQETCKVIKIVRKMGQDLKKVPTKRPRLYVFDHERPCKAESQPKTQVDVKFWILPKAAPIRRPVNNDTLAMFFSLLAESLPVLLMASQARYFSLTHFDGLPSVHVSGRSVVTGKQFRMEYSWYWRWRFQW
jgi:hypothetical protein